MMRRWDAVAGSQIGSVHVRDGTPMQDAYRAWATGDVAAIAVADGHGHRQHFRSQIGSQIAVDVAMALLRSSVADFREAAAVAEQLTSEIGPRLVHEWTATVREHFANHPLTEIERALVGSGVAVDDLRPYGSTVVAMAASRHVLAVLQIGDGDAVVVTAGGHCFRPLPVDEDLAGLSTTSLCQPDPLRSLRCSGLDVGKDDVALGFICTDGFGSPRVDTSGWWMQVGAELLDHARTQGFQFIADKLPTWLQEPAEYGGDDTTLAVIGVTGLV